MEELWSDDESEKFFQKSSAISALLVVFWFVAGFGMQCMCFWGFRPQKRLILLQIDFGGV